MSLNNPSFLISVVVLLGVLGFVTNMVGLGGAKGDIHERYQKKNEKKKNGSTWEAPPYEGEAEPAWQGGEDEGRAAYVTFIGNEKYVDGALVLGYTLKQQSEYLQADPKLCDTVVMTSPTVGEPALSRLARVFDKVVAISKSATLSRNIPGTTWGTTFDKFYLYNLTDYKVIAFLDADIVMLQNPDSIFATKLPHDRYWIAAVPGHSSKGYFHTGAMVLRPGKDLLDELLAFYTEQRDSKKDKYKFRSSNGRDGLVMRYFIDGRVIFLGNKYSAQHGQGKWVVGLHLSGTWKPWYNRHGDHKEISTVKQELRTKEMYGSGHTKWWEAYEEMHHKLFTSKADVKEWEETFDDGSPKTHVWMMRGTDWEYTQPFKAYKKKS